MVIVVTVGRRGPGRWERLGGNSTSRGRLITSKKPSKQNKKEPTLNLKKEKFIRKII